MVLKEGFYYFGKDEDEKISPNFTCKEYACKCNEDHECKIAEEIVIANQFLRDHLNVLAQRYNAFLYPNKPISITITSGDRCDSHNLRVGGAIDGLHPLGIASDLKVNNFKKLRYDKLGLIAYKTGYYNGIGIAKTFIHLDVRDGSQNGMGLALWYY